MPKTKPKNDLRLFPRGTIVEPGGPLDVAINEYAAILGDPDYARRWKDHIREVGSITDPDEILAAIDRADEMFGKYPIFRTLFLVLN